MPGSVCKSLSLSRTQQRSSTCPRATRHARSSVRRTSYWLCRGQSPKACWSATTLQHCWHQKRQVCGWCQLLVHCDTGRKGLQCVAAPAWHVLNSLWGDWHVCIPYMSLNASQGQGAVLWSLLCEARLCLDAGRQTKQVKSRVWACFLGAQPVLADDDDCMC